MKSIEVSGKNVDQAIEIGLFKLEAKRDDVKIIILDDGGLFSKARVKLILKSDENNKTEVENLVDEFFSSIDLNVHAEVTEEDENITINILGSDIGVLIGKRGDVLDAIQYLFSQMINKGKSNNDFKRILIDSEGYRTKREETLKLLALRLANKSIREGRLIKLEPMSASERRIIHTVLQSRNDIKTLSKGEEPNRYITISPSAEYKYAKNNKNKNNKNSFEKNQSETITNGNRDFND